MSKSKRYNFSDFTERHYRQILEKINKNNYESIGFDDKRITNPDNNNLIIFRHDIDHSVHRAVKLAEIDSLYEIKSTFFVRLRGDWYNVFEPDIHQRLVRIIDLGHDIGLHFEPYIYANTNDITKQLLSEKHILENFLDYNIKSFSWHQPDRTGVQNIRDVTMAGMTNASSGIITEKFYYNSDSNGYWRFKRLYDIIDPNHYPRLYVLTHPVMWQKRPMSPRNRIMRSLEGHTNNKIQLYDHITKITGRRNIR